MRIFDLYLDHNFLFFQYHPYIYIETVYDEGSSLLESYLAQIASDVDVMDIEGIVRKSGVDMAKIKAIIFDWGRTLYDSENQVLFPETEHILQVLSVLYMLVIVSLASDGDIEKRIQALRGSGIEKYFAAVYLARNDKDSLYALALSRLALSANEVAIVDDRVIRGIKWGNACGATTIWLRQGKFAHEEPNEETGPPTHIISTLGEICSLALE